jgi:hypothetical protein
MYTKSVNQVARSWVDVGSFHTRLVVRFMIGTASVRNIWIHTRVHIFLFRAKAPSGPSPPHARGFKITHNDAPQSVGLLWTSDQPVAEIST